MKPLSSSCTISEKTELLSGALHIACDAHSPQVLDCAVALGFDLDATWQDCTIDVACARHTRTCVSRFPLLCLGLPSLDSSRSALDIRQHPFSVFRFCPLVGKLSQASVVFHVVWNMQKCVEVIP